MPWQYSWVDTKGAKNGKGGGTNPTPPAGGGIPGDQWQCQHCSYKMPSGKTKCTACGLRKNFKPCQNQSQAKPPELPKAQDAPTSAVRTSTNGVRQALDSLTSTVLALAPKSNSPSAAAPTNAAKKEIEELTSPALTIPKDKEAFSAAKARVKSLEETIKILPAGPDFDAARAEMQSRLETAKRDVNKCRPLGARIDAARLALARSQQRVNQAAEAAKLAVEVHNAAINEGEELTKSLAELEKEWTESAIEDSSSDGMVLGLKTSLGTVMKSLKARPGIQEEHIVAAQQQFELLLSGIVKTIAAAEVSATKYPIQAEASALRSGHDAEADWQAATATKRHRAKEPPTTADIFKATAKEAPQDETGGDTAQSGKGAHRLNGKKTLLDYWYGPASKRQETVATRAVPYTNPEAEKPSPL